jgi:hypothetical protein
VRRERIVSLEAQRRANVPRSQLEVEAEQERDFRRQLADVCKVEEMDDARLIRAMQQYAIAATVRDRQLEERRQRREQERALERMRDIEMEIARLEEVKRVHDREEAQRTVASASARGIYEQLAQREQRRRDDVERVRTEGERTKAAMQRAEEEWRQRVEAEKRVKAVQLEEFRRITEEALATKQRRVQAEREADEKVARDQAEAERKRLEAEAEAARKQKEREDALFRVRGEVQKLQDQRGAVDELRARRQFEEGQRVERQRELERVRRAKAMREELAAARVEQLALKQQRLAVELEVDKAEFDENARLHAAWIASERATAQRRRDQSAQHVQDLLRQKQDAEEAERAAVQSTRGEGRDIKATEEQRQARIRQLKEAAVKELEELGVDLRYAAPILRYDPQKLLMSDYKLGQRTATKGAAAGAGATGKK